MSVSNGVKQFIKKAVNLSSYDIRYLSDRIKNGRKRPLAAKDERALIVGNGPSAGRLDFEHYRQQGYAFMCVNDFALKTDLLYQIRPRYYCCIDDAMYSRENLANNKDVIAVYEALNHIPWKMEFVCRYGQVPPLNNPNINVVHVNSCVLKDSFKRLQYRRYARNKACSGFQNVICCCLYFAITSRFRDILLTGVEFDMHKELQVEANNDVIREYRHFYGVNRVNITEAGQIGKGEIYKYFYFSYLTLFQYKLLYDYSVFSGIEVKNLTLNSTIDSIPKIAPVEKPGQEE